MIKRFRYIIFANTLPPADIQKQNEAMDLEMSDLLDTGWRETSAVGKSVTFKRSEDGQITHTDWIIYSFYKRGKA